MDDHLGYGRHAPAGRDGGNSRNGKRGKTLLTGAGPVDIEVPRDRDATFEPRIVAKRQRRLTGGDDLVISLSARCFDPRRDQRAPGRGVRGGGVQADDLHDHRAIAKDLKPVYTAPSEAAALDRLAKFSYIWERKYRAIVRLWTNAWAEFM